MFVLAGLIPRPDEHTISRKRASATAFWFSIEATKQSAASTL